MHIISDDIYENSLISGELMVSIAECLHIKNLKLIKYMSGICMWLQDLEKIFLIEWPESWHVLHP